MASRAAEERTFSVGKDILQPKLGGRSDSYFQKLGFRKRNIILLREISQ